MDLLSASYRETRTQAGRARDGPARQWRDISPPGHDEKLLGAGSGKAGIEPLIRYALSLPVSTAVIGMPMLQFIDQNIAIAKSFNPMNAGEMDQLRAQVASQRVSLENFFIRHRDEAV